MPYSVGLVNKRLYTFIPQPDFTVPIHSQRSYHSTWPWAITGKPQIVDLGRHTGNTSHEKWRKQTHPKEGNRATVCTENPVNSKSQTTSPLNIPRKAGSDLLRRAIRAIHSGRAYVEVNIPSTDEDVQERPGGSAAEAVEASSGSAGRIRGARQQANQTISSRRSCTSM